MDVLNMEWVSLIKLKKILHIDWKSRQNVPKNKGVDEDATKDKEDLLKKIETITCGVIESLSNGESPVLSYISHQDWDAVQYKDGEGIQTSENKKVSYIRCDNEKSFKKFGLIMKVLSVIYKLLQENKYCTKRDLYYQDPESFGKQKTLDSIVDSIASILKVPRWELHVLATSKGAIAGDLQFYNEVGVHIDCRGTKIGVQVPAHKKDMLNISTNARFLLIVEKDATFQKLLDEQFCEKYSPCILTTAKGFPDLGTRLLLRLLWDIFQLPMFALVDCDPYGIEIMSVYKFGSKAQACENHYLSVPTIKWLGILPSETKRLNIPDSSLIPMTQRDMEKTAQLLQRPYVKSNWKMEEQLQRMLQMGRKAEIQCLDSLSSNYLCDVYIPSKISNSDWI